jgi:hypothetical protein
MDKGQGEIGVISLGTNTLQSPHLIQVPLIEFSCQNERYPVPIWSVQRLSSPANARIAAS